MWQSFLHNNPPCRWWWSDARVRVARDPVWRVHQGHERVKMERFLIKQAEKKFGKASIEVKKLQEAKEKRSAPTHVMEGMKLKERRVSLADPPPPTPTTNGVSASIQSEVAAQKRAEARKRSLFDDIDKVVKKAKQDAAGIECTELLHAAMEMKSVAMNTITQQSIDQHIHELSANARWFQGELYIALSIYIYAHV